MAQCASFEPAVGRARARPKTPAQANKIKGGTPCHARSRAALPLLSPWCLSRAISCASARRQTIRPAPSPSSCRSLPAPAWTPPVRLYGEKLVADASASPSSSRTGPGGAGVVAGETIAKGAARRLYARGRDQRRDGDPADAVQAAAVRSAHRLRADLALREIAVRVHRQSVAAGPLGSRVHQVRQGAAGTAQLQLVRASAGRRT